MGIRQGETIEARVVDLVTSAAAAVGNRYCANIHAGLIAQAEALGNCTTKTVSAAPPSVLGAGCAGLTADACAKEHFEGSGRPT